MSALFKFIPLENFLTGSGKEEITKEQLNRRNTLSIKRHHDEDFFKRRESLTRQSFFQDKGLDLKTSVQKRSSVRIDG